MKKLALEPTRKLRGRPRKSLASIENIPGKLLAPGPAKQLPKRVKRNSNEDKLGEEPTKNKTKTETSKQT